MSITRTWTINPETGRQEVSCTGSYGGLDESQVQALIDTSVAAVDVDDPDYRVSSSVASTATLTVDADTYQQASVTAQAAALTIAAPTGTPVDGQKLVIRIKDNGTARALTWNAVFAVVGVTLPTTTVVGKKHYIGCRWNAAAAKWDVLAVAAEA